MMNFNNLISNIQQTHSYLQSVAARAVNTPMTVRNWLIGYYIIEFELNGEDRAVYGEQLIRKLEKELTNQGLKGFSFTNLNIFRQFYLAYPEIIQTVSEYFTEYPIVQTLSDKLVPVLNEHGIEHSGTKKYGLSPKKILNQLSFSHLVELIKIDDDLKRAFYKYQ